MKSAIAILLLLFAGCLSLVMTQSFASRFGPTISSPTSTGLQAAISYQPSSLCARNEQIIFNCTLQRSTKIVSLCGSKDLTKESGYLQYRFGLPGKVDLEFPKTRTRTQEQFTYSHYFRYQVDLTEINFTSEGYQYQIFDNYNGEEKRKISEAGVRVTAPGKPKDVSLVCRGKAKADYSNLQDILTRAEN